MLPDNENIDPVNRRRRGGYARKGRDAVQCVYAITRLRAFVVHKQCGHITYRWPAPAVLLLCISIYIHIKIFSDDLVCLFSSSYTFEMRAQGTAQRLSSRPLARMYHRSLHRTSSRPPNLQTKLGVLEVRWRDIKDALAKLAVHPRRTQSMHAVNVVVITKRACLKPSFLIT